MVAECFSFQEESILNNATLLFRLLFHTLTLSKSRNSSFNFKGYNVCSLYSCPLSSYTPCSYRQGGKKTFQCLINLKSIRGCKVFILLPWFRSSYIQQHNKCTLCLNTNALSTSLHFSRVGTKSIFLELWKFLAKTMAAQLIRKQGEVKITLQ